MATTSFFTPVFSASFSLLILSSCASSSTPGLSFSTRISFVAWLYGLSPLTRSSTFLMSLVRRTVIGGLRLSYSSWLGDRCRCFTIYLQLTACPNIDYHTDYDTRLRLSITSVFLTDIFTEYHYAVLVSLFGTVRLY